MATIDKIPNPQGKGLVTAFASLEESRARISVPPKHINQVSNELFTSLFVLQSRFHFKPVVGRPYWLYRRDNRFDLSMVSPREWNGSRDAEVVGECELQPDMTWVLQLEPQAAEDDELMACIEDRRRKFEQALAAADTLEFAMPYYVAELPFYQRVFASVLACSLRDSMAKSNISGLNYAQARGLLESRSQQQPG